MGRMKLKGKKKKTIFRFLILFIVFLITIYFSFKFITSMNIKFNSKDIVNYLLHNYKSEDIVNDNISKRIKTVFKLDSLLGMKTINNSKVTKISNKVTTNNKPIVYIYNTHQKVVIKQVEYLWKKQKEKIVA